eukprot:m.340123 g.340123  ORF g.340123 m.340123 type:complete len:429 (-) comp20591_c0_seq5:3579-4865(-)
MAATVSSADKTMASQVQYLSFSEDGKAFACGHSRGFATFRTDTAQTIHSGQESTTGSNGGVSIARIIDESSEYVAVVGDGRSPLRPKNKVLIWQESENCFITELEFKSEVLGAVLSKSRIIVVVMTQVHVYSFERRPKRLTVIDTGSNPKGLCVVSGDARVSTPIIAAPSRDEGSLQITDLVKSDGVTIAAHAIPLVCLCFNADASQIATASLKGTCIRLFSTATGDVLRELRRGVDHAVIRCMAFSNDKTRLIIASDKKTHSTIHLFSLTTDDAAKNKHSKLYGLRSLLPQVFSSEWSSCQFHCPEANTICAFGTDRNKFVGIVHWAVRYVRVVDVENSALFDLDRSVNFRCYIPYILIALLLSGKCTHGVCDKPEGGTMRFTMLSSHTWLDWIVAGFNGTIYTCKVDQAAKGGCKLTTTGNFLTKF